MSAGDLAIRDSRWTARGSGRPGPCAARLPARGFPPSVRPSRSRISVEFFQLPALGAGAGGRAGAGLVLGDEFFQVPPLGQHGGVGALVAFAPLLLVFQEGIDLAGIHRQLAAGQIQRLRAGGARGRPDRATRSGRLPGSCAKSVRAEFACASRGSSSVRRAAAGWAHAARGRPASRASANRRRAWRRVLRAVRS